MAHWVGLPSSIVVCIVGLECLHALLHSNKLSTKHASFNCGLLLWMPHSWCHVEIYQESHMHHHVSLSPAWSDRQTCIGHNVLSSSWRSIGRNCFLHFTIELFPITLLENSKINIWIRGIIYDLCIVCLLKISKQMEQCIQMSLLRQH